MKEQDITGIVDARTPEKPKHTRPLKSEQLKPQTDPGDNAKYIGLTMKLWQLPKVDLKDPVAVEERLEKFFALHYEADMKPTVVGMAMALGVSRQSLWAIKTGSAAGGMGYPMNVPKETADSVKKAYDFMENLWENYMQNGKINPVSGIFLGKNNFGYKDQSEHILTPRVEPENDYGVEDIRQRYMVEDNAECGIRNAESG